MALSTSLFSSIPVVAMPPIAKVAPCSMPAGVGAKVAPLSMPASSKVAPFSMPPAGAKVGSKARFATRSSANPVLSNPVLSTDFDDDLLHRSDFGNDFIFGTATSAYQIEGGIDLRGRSAWDNFTQRHPDKIKDFSNGNIACNSYELFQEDIKIMKEMGVKAYRFSIAWSRIVPTGKKDGKLNDDGIKYYNKLLDELKANGITPFVTLFHVDRPQPLEDEYEGFLDSRIVEDFKYFADACFKYFGEKVKNWITLNEPYTYCHQCYTEGFMAPGRCSGWMDNNCIGGNSATEPYIVAHNLLLAHSAVVDLYKTKYEHQKGNIGITLDCTWSVPMSDSEEDKKAADRGRAFKLGWFLEPLVSGDYPDIMKELVGGRLPKFTTEQSQKLTGSYDFLGINYYTSQYAANMPEVTTPPSNLTDARVEFSYFRNGMPIGGETASGMYVYPQGLRDLLIHVKENYDDECEIYITENGMADYDLDKEEACMDIRRIDYYYRHLYHVRSAKRKGVNVKGYFAWSLLDNFEWALGYTLRFGLHYIDYNDENLTRHKKYSARWFQQFLADGTPKTQPKVPSDFSLPVPEILSEVNVN